MLRDVLQKKTEEHSNRRANEKEENGESERERRVHIKSSSFVAPSIQLVLRHRLFVLMCLYIG